MDRIITLFLMAVVVLTAASCRTDVTTPPGTQTVDREGNPITLPQKINRIISLGPSNTEILVDLGFAGKIVASDTYSRGIDGLASDIPFFNMMAPDGEQIIQLEPDVIFVTGMSKGGGIDPFKVVSDVGICVLYIPSSSGIADIKADIKLIATVMGVVEKGEKIVAVMEKTMDATATIGKTIRDKKRVYFEISAESYSLYSFGSGVYLNEMLEIIGAENIFADRKQWMVVAEEAILDRNPDVILTNANAFDKPVEVIMARPGWGALTAVQNGDVYSIDTDSSSRPSHRIVKALQEMAKAVYPDKY